MQKASVNDFWKWLMIWVSPKSLTSLRGNAQRWILLTNRQFLVAKCKPIPGINDHDTIVQVDSRNHGSEEASNPTENSYVENSDMIDIWDDLQKFLNQFLSTFEPTRTVNDMGNETKHAINTAIDKDVPAKMSTLRFSQP